MRAHKSVFLTKTLLLSVFIFLLVSSSTNATALGIKTPDLDNSSAQSGNNQQIQLSTIYPIETLEVNEWAIQPTPPHAFTIGSHLRIYVEVISWKKTDYLEVWAQINGGTGTVWDSDIEYGVSSSVSYAFYMDLDIPQNFEPGLTCLKIKRYDANGTFEETCYQILLVSPQNLVVLKDVGITNPAYAGDKLYYEPVLWNLGSNDLDVKVLAEVTELGTSRTEYLHIASGDQLAPGQRYLDIPFNAQTGYYDLTVTISYDGGQETKKYSFDIVNGTYNNAPSLQDMPNFSANVNDTISFNLIGQDPDGNPIEFSDSSEHCTTSKAGQATCSFEAPGIYYEKFNVKDPWVENHQYIGFSISSPTVAQVDLAITDILVKDAVAFEQTIVEIVVSNNGWGGWTGGPAQFTLVVSDPNFDTPYAVSGRSVVQAAQFIERIGPLSPGQSTSIKIPVVFKDAIHSKRLEVAMAGVSSININDINWSIFDLDQSTNNNVASIEGDDKFLVTESFETLDNCVFGPITLFGQFLPLTGKLIGFLDDVHDGLEYGYSTYEFYITMSKSIDALGVTGDIALNGPTDAERIQATGKLLLSIHNLMSPAQWENLYGLPSGTGKFAKNSLKVIQIANNEINGSGCIALFPDAYHIVAGWTRSLVREIDFLAPDEKVTYYAVESPADLIITDGNNTVTSIGVNTQLVENIPFSFAFYSGEQKVIAVVDSNTNLSVKLKGTDTGTMTFSSLVPSAGADNTLRRYFNLPTSSSSTALLLPASNNTIISDKNGDGIYEDEFTSNESSTLTNNKIILFENSNSNLIFDFSQPGTITSSFIKIQKDTKVVGAFLSITGQKSAQFPQYPSVDLGNGNIFNYPGMLSTTESVEDFSDQLNSDISNCIPDSNNNCTLSISVTSLSTGRIVLSHLVIYTLDSTEPGNVTNLTLTPNVGFISLNWTASTSTDVAGYNVYIDEGNGFNLDADVGQATFYNSALLKNQNYSFLVTTYDHALNESDGVKISGTPLENINRVMINEVDTGSSDAVELYNSGSQTVNLSGWHLIAYDSTHTVDVDYIIPSGFTLNPGAFVIIHETSGTNTATDLYISGSPISWGNSNATGAVTLTDGTNGVDFVRFGGSAVSPPSGITWTPPNPAGHPNRHTLGRSPSSTDTDAGSDWCSQVPTLGAQNANCGIVGPIIYQSQLIDDDTSSDPNNDSKGNNNGIANCGESVELFVTLKNQGQVSATGISATISTTDQYVTWSAFNKSSSYPSIPASNGTAANTDDFDFSISPNTPNGHLIHFEYNVSAAVGGPWSMPFDVPVTCIMPEGFDKLSPASGALVVSTNPIISWEPSNQAASYEFCYDTTDDNACSTWMKNELNTSKLLSGLSNSTTYYWQVRAINPAGTMYANGNDPNNFWTFKTLPPLASSGSTYDDKASVWSYSGVWSTQTATSASGGSYKYTTATGASTTVYFSGIQVKLYFTKNSSMGNLAVYIDDDLVTTINQKASIASYKQTWLSPVYADEIHKITFVRSSSKVNVDALQVIPAPDFIPPAGITNLSARSGTAFGQVNLQWNSVGDDGNSGTASSYQIRYSTTAIDTDTKWTAATPVTNGIPIPVIAGTSQSMTVSGLAPSLTYYFAIRAVDDGGNLSPLSNSAFAVALAPTPVLPGTYDNLNPNWIFSGSWTTATTAGAFGGNVATSSTTGSSAALVFNGSGFTLRYYTKYGNGSLAVYVDGVLKITLSQKSSSSLIAWKNYAISGLTPGTHVIQLVDSTGKVNFDSITISP